MERRSRDRLYTGLEGTHSGRLCVETELEKAYEDI